VRVSCFFHFPVYIANIIFLCVGYEDLGPSRVVLDNGRLSGSVMKDGKFVMSAHGCPDRDYDISLTVIDA
jgi:hypothetical protein